MSGRPLSTQRDDQSSEELPTSPPLGIGRPSINNPGTPFSPLSRLNPLGGSSNGRPSSNLHLEKLELNQGNTSRRLQGLSNNEGMGSPYGSVSLHESNSMNDRGSGGGGGKNNGSLRTRIVVPEDFVDRCALNP